jgi:hypothetical protein
LGRTATPLSVTPAILFLASESAPSRAIVGAGAGVFSVVRIAETPGMYLDDDERTPEVIAARWDEIFSQQAYPLNDAFAQTRKFAAAAGAARGIQLKDL